MLDGLDCELYGLLWEPLPDDSWDGYIPSYFDDHSITAVNTFAPVTL